MSLEAMVFVVLMLVRVGTMLSVIVAKPQFSGAVGGQRQEDGVGGRWGPFQLTESPPPPFLSLKTSALDRTVPEQREYAERQNML